MVEVGIYNRCGGARDEFLGNLGLRKIRFFKEKKCRNHGQTEWGESQNEKGRKSRRFDPSTDWHLVLDPLDLFFFSFVYFHFQLRSDFF